MVLLSAIIPLARGEFAWENLLPDLAMLEDGVEIIFVVSEDSEKCINAPVIKNKTVHVIKAKPGRASQMNAGAKIAKGKFLWFLHADSKFERTAGTTLMRAMQCCPYRLLYFDLIFLDDAPYWMRLNEWGVWFRSHILKVPFGDQGFCIQKKLFEQMGGFAENLSYGEDHVFVWRARQNRIKLMPVGAVLYTSARKYKKYGWLKTTCMHQYLWIKQALPEWVKLIAGYKA